MTTTAGVLCGRMKWYQVVLLVGRSEVRDRVQATTVDGAVRLVMRSQGITCADSASIWLLGRSGAPTLRTAVCCRLPRMQSCSVVS